jgi:hypothetical protein
MYDVLLYTLMNAEFRFLCIKTRISVWRALLLYPRGLQTTIQLLVVSENSSLVKKKMDINV